MKPSEVIVLSESIPSLLPLLLDLQSSSGFGDRGTRKLSPVLEEGRFDPETDVDFLPMVPFCPSYTLISLISEATTLERDTDVVAGVRTGLLELERPAQRHPPRRSLPRRRSDHPRPAHRTPGGGRRHVLLDPPDLLRPGVSRTAGAQARLSARRSRPRHA